MEIDSELFEKGAVGSEGISRGVEDGLLFDSSEDLHKSLFASLDSFSIPLSPRPAICIRGTNSNACKLDTDATSTGELDETSTFTTSTARSNVHLQDLVSSNDLGVAIQQETPQLLMEGDTLDDHVSLDDQANCHDQAALDSLDTICVGAQEETVNSLCDQNSIMELLLSTTDTAHDNDVDQLSVHSSLGSSASFTSSYDVMDHRNTNVDHVTTPSDHVTTSSGHVTTSKAHVITPTQQIALPNLCTHTDKNGISLAMNFTETSAIPSSCTSHTDSSAGTHLSSSLVSSSSVSIPYAVTLYAASTVPCSIVVPLSNCRYVSATSSHCSTQCSNIPVPYTTTSSSYAVSGSNSNKGSCDDIIGQSLMLANSTVQDSPQSSSSLYQLVQEVFKPCTSQQSDKTAITCTTASDGNSCSGNQPIELCEETTHQVDSSGSHDLSDAGDSPSDVITPLKIPFIDWTQIRRKNVTPSSFPSTPTPINVEMQLDTNKNALGNKRKNSNPTSEPKKRGWVKGRRRKKVVPQAVQLMPKPPCTGYMYYLSDHRGEVMKKNPSMTLGEVSKYLAATWSQLPSEQRQAYIDKGYVDRQRYLDELVKYYHQRNNDFKQQEPSFDPEWANKYLGQYLNSDSDVLYCSICDLQFSSLHNKQQHCLSRKHNEEVVKFVLKSIRSRRKNGSAKNKEDHKTDIQNTISNHQSTVNNADQLNIVEDHTSSVENIVKDHVSIVEDHVSIMENHVGSNENKGHAREGDNEDHVTTTNNRITKDVISIEEDHTNNHFQFNADHANNSICTGEDTSLQVVDLTNENTGDHSLSDPTTHVDHVIVNGSEDNHDTSSEEQSEESLECPISFPPQCSIGHVIHDFTLYQQGMKSDLTSRNSSLHVSNAQLQSENNEYKVRVEDARAILADTRQKNILLLSQLETLSKALHSVGQLVNGNDTQ